VTKIIIAGPCVIESVDHFVGFADDLVRLFEDFPDFRLVYKGSFDKANRTRQGSPRGVGLVEAEVAWYKLKQTHPNLHLTTDIHETWQAEVAARWVDVLQIPAMLGRQTPLLNAVARTGKIVNLKKPVWEGIQYFADASTKLGGASQVWNTYRGTGTKGNLSVDLHDLLDMWGEYPPAFNFFDVTHTNGGDMWRTVRMARAARAIGFENFFAEVHPEPALALCDANHQLSVRALEHMLGAISEYR
jgi:2-dehydro-3-deoxyphosphooctonate aldolase (KDO 8-P synthase)